MNAKLDVSLADSFQDPEARMGSYLHAYYNTLDVHGAEDLSRLAGGHGFYVEFLGDCGIVGVCEGKGGYMMAW